MRNYKRKTDWGTTPQEVIKSAVAAVLVCQLPIRTAAKEFGITAKALTRYVKKAKEQAQPDETLGTPTIPASLHFGYVKKQVFTADQETHLAEYLKQTTDIYHGLPSKEMRKLAVTYGKMLNVKMPPSWLENEVAGSDWFSAFLKRQHTWSIKLPEASNQSTSVCIQRFISNLELVLKRLSIGSTDIWSMDEIAVITGQSHDRIVTRRVTEQLKKQTPADDGNSAATVAVTLSAYGNTIPPFFISQKDASQGRETNEQPAVHWLNAATFMDFMTHFIKFARPSKDRPILLLLNFETSCLSFELLDLIEANGIILKSYPPRTGDRLQPFERTIIDPLNHYVNSGCDSWMANNPSKKITVRDIAHILRRALILACTPHAITLGFQATGIYPLNSETFSSSGNCVPACGSFWEESECVRDNSGTASNSSEIQSVLYATDQLNPEEFLEIQQIASHVPEGFSDWTVSHPPSGELCSPQSEPICDYNSFRERISSTEDVKPSIQVVPRRSSRRGRKRKMPTTFCRDAKAPEDMAEEDLLPNSI